MDNAPAQTDTLLGRQFGNYVVRQKLGEGGMGSVYLAEHPAIGKKVALKILHAEFAANHDVATRFFNEAKAVNDIQHPNIVDVVDYGVIQDAGSGTSLVYFIMEFLAGQSLTDLVRREAPMAPERVLTICIQIADALSASHNRGIVHRDLKPDNVMLLQRGRERDFVKVLDFGIAKLTGNQAGSSRTRTGIVMGTPSYMSPEQCEGRGNIDHRTDIYALGIVMYEMITGRVPFVGEGYGEILIQHLTATPPPPSTIRGLIPPHVEQIVMKALEKRPENRYPTMEEFMRAITDPVGYVEGHGGVARFIATPLPTSQGVLPPISAVRQNPLTPPPGAMANLPSRPHMTPPPGFMASIPGNHATPTTLGASVGQFGYAPAASSRAPLFAGLAIAVAAIAIGIFFLVRGGGHDKAPAATAGSSQGSTATPSPEAGTGAAPGSAAASAGNAAGSVTGSAATGSAAGSAEAIPRMVTIELVTLPPDADVYVGTESKPRGKTPFTLRLPRSDQAVDITYMLNGYNDKREQVTPSSSKELETRLQKQKKKVIVDDNPCKHTGSDDTMNPFCR